MSENIKLVTEKWTPSQDELNKALVAASLASVDLLLLFIQFIAAQAA